MLIDIIETIFRSAGYEEILLPFHDRRYLQTLFQGPAASGRQEYFIILEERKVEPNALLDILQHQADYLFENIILSGSVGEHFEKNSTLIICHRDRAPAFELILALEEDPYNFKKNVIRYTEDELTKLRHELSQHSAVDHFCNDLFNSLVNAGNGAAFRQFKESMGAAQSHYSLLLKIAAKIPLLSYYSTGNNLYNLDQDIISQLEPEEVQIYETIAAHHNIETDESLIALVNKLSSL